MPFLASCWCPTRVGQWNGYDASESCRRSEKKKKKKRDTARHQNSTRRTHSVVRHVLDTNMMQKMACPRNLRHNIVRQLIDNGVMFLDFVRS